MTLEPEQDKYTMVLTIDYADLARPEEAIFPAAVNVPGAGPVNTALSDVEEL
jgi:hypothetical protein